LWVSNGALARRARRGPFHNISEKFSRNLGASIPPNLIAMPNTESNGRYLRYCKAQGLRPHPARFPATLPEYFVRMLTDPGDLVVDPFAGSCVTGEVCERLGRKWLCVELVEEYLRGALGRFKRTAKKPEASPANERKASQPISYKVFQPGFGWNGPVDPVLSQDGGKKRILRQE